MNDSNKPARFLDLRGRICPAPVIETAAAMRALSEGEELELVADDPGARMDIPAWCRSQGQRLVSLIEEGRLTRIRIVRQGLIR